MIYRRPETEEEKDNESFLRRFCICEEDLGRDRRDERRLKRPALVPEREYHSD